MKKFVRVLRNWKMAARADIELAKFMGGRIAFPPASLGDELVKRPQLPNYTISPSNRADDDALIE